MSDQSQSEGGRVGLAFILGGVVVVLAGLVWYLYSGGELPGQDDPDVKIELPGVTIEGEAE